MSRLTRKVRVLAISVGALCACGPAIPAYRVERLPSGRALKILDLDEIQLESGEAALSLAYETDLALDDRAALYREVEAIWSELRSSERARGRSAALIRATTPEVGGWSREREAVAYALRRAPDGQWHFLDSDAARQPR